MKIAMASDHRGYQLKDRLARMVEGLGNEVVDLGPNSGDSVDYPDFAEQVASSVSHGDVDRGVLICGTGIGMCIAANKFPGVRAASCHDALTAEMSRRHNDANIICLSADLLGGGTLIDQMLEKFLTTEFECDAERHVRRLQKIREIEDHVSNAEISKAPEVAGEASA